MLAKSITIALLTAGLTLVGPTGAASAKGTKESSKGSTVLVCPRGARPKDCFRVVVR